MLRSLQHCDRCRVDHSQRIGKIMSLRTTFAFENLFTPMTVGLITLYLAFHWFRRPKNFPPGPTGLPFLGVVPWLGNYLQKTFVEWSKKYGPVMSVRIGMEDFVVLNDFESIQEALIKNKEQFSGRPKIPIFEQVTEGHGIVFLDYDNKWKSQRKFGLLTLRGFGVGKKSMEERVQEEVHYLNQIIQKKEGEPFDIQPHLSNALSNNICSVVFGKRFHYNDECFTEIMKQLTRSFVESKNSKGLGILVYAPFLMYFPPFKQISQRFMNDIGASLALVRDVVADHKATYDAENPRDFIDVFIGEMVKKEDKSFTEKQLLHFVRDLFVAGTETTTSTLRWAILCLLHYPEIQKKLYEEILAVVGTEATVGMKHKSDMPYTSAFIEELYRFRTLVPLNAPHKTTEDATLYGYRIPKGVQIISNIWAVHNDPSLFEEPHKFKPERHLDENGKFLKSKYVIPFSVGPRHCLGEQLARMEVFIFLVSMVQKFKFEAGDSDQNMLQEGTAGVINAPVKYKVVAKDR